jgi:curli biogenesis system outer membrane secretion channel CsgG
MTHQSIHAQQSEMENIRDACKNIPMTERIPIVVDDFKVTADSLKSELGKDLMLILSSTLAKIDCFKVFEKSYTDINDSIMLKRPQFMVIGDITDYEQAPKKANLLSSGISMGKKAHLSCILKVIHIETRQIVMSKQISTESIKSSSFNEFGCFGKITYNKYDRAFNDCIEKTVIIACNQLIQEKDKYIGKQ